MTDPDVLQPMNTAEIISRTFRLYINHLAALVLVALIPHIAFLVVYTVVENTTEDVIALNLLTMFATILMNAIALGAITISIALATAVDPPTVGTVYRLLGRRSLISLVVAYLLTVFITSIAFMPVIASMLRGGAMLFTIPIMLIPGLVLGGLFTTTIPVIVLERRSALSAIVRSMGLMRRDLAKSVAIFTFILLISGFLPMAFHLTIGLGPLSPLLNAVLGSALLPLAYTANVLLYFSARSREGYSPEVLAEELMAP